MYSETEFATTLRGFASEVDKIRQGHAERRKEEIKAAKQQSREAVRSSPKLPRLLDVGRRGGYWVTGR